MFRAINVQINVKPNTLSPLFENLAKADTYYAEIYARDALTLARNLVTFGKQIVLLNFDI